MSKLYFRYSAMNAGKTTQVLQVKFNYEERGQRVLLIKPSIDTREGTAPILKSRIGLESECSLLGADQKIMDLVSDQNWDCILVDEAQFLTKEQAQELARIVDEENIPVLCYGLRSDFRGELFPGSAVLMALADSIEELKTVCWCGRKALMNTRVQDGKAVYEGAQVQIGGNESYISLCRKHWRTGNLAGLEVK